MFGSALFFFIAPGTVAGVIPWWISRWHMSASFFGIVPLRALGISLIAAGLAVVVESFVRFALQGLGTPAPIAPAQRLVVSGLYRYVRNPMYLGVLAAIVGQALLFSSVGLLVYAVVVALSFQAFVVIYEEPTLRATFGSDYAAFCARVPRWIPRARR